MGEMPLVVRAPVAARPAAVELPAVTSHLGRGPSRALDLTGAGGIRQAGPTGVGRAHIVRRTSGFPTRPRPTPGLLAQRLDAGLPARTAAIRAAIEGVGWATSAP